MIFGCVHRGVVCYRIQMVRIVGRLPAILEVCRLPRIMTTQEASSRPILSGADMNSVANPYHVVPGVASSLPRDRRAAAIGLSILVAVGSFLIMAALLFGIVVAIAGTTMPAMSYSGQFLKSEPGRRFLLLTIAAVPIALLLGIFCYSRITRAQRLISEASLRREELRAQLQSLLRAERSAVAPNEAELP